MKDLATDDDQQVRSAVIEISDWKGRTSLLRRNVQHLYLIEVRDEDIEDVPTTEEESITVSQVKLIQTTNLTEATDKERRSIKVQNTSNMTDIILVLVVTLYH